MSVYVMCVRLIKTSMCNIFGHLYGKFGKFGTWDSHCFTAQSIDASWRHVAYLPFQVCPMLRYSETYDI